MDAAALRAQFPVCERVAYLNSGTDGPLPAAAADAARGALDAELGEGRITPHFQARMAAAGGAAGRLRTARWARRRRRSRSRRRPPTGSAACSPGSTLGPGDEVITSDEEHPGLIGPLVHARARGATVRAVPLREVADAVGPRTRARRRLPRELGRRRRRAGGARRGRRPGGARRRAGRRRGAGRRARAGLRGLRRGGPEVAVRRGRDGPAVDRPRVRRARPGGLPQLRVLRRRRAAGSTPR